ncbi:MAG: hypothetical protein HY719_00960 [Planctomycetes bacterium]|nr:hypothetical protein [Planctomycetota bacterium]
MTPPGLSLKIALRRDSRLRPLVQSGLNALKRSDRKTIAKSDRKRVTDSLDLDAGVQAEFPQDHRWDYLLSVPDCDSIVGVESHKAADSEISVIIKKRQGALDVLRAHLQPGRFVKRWYWVTSSKVGFSDTGTARRRLAQKGITFAGREIRSLGR